MANKKKLTKTKENKKKVNIVSNQAPDTMVEKIALNINIFNGLLKTLIKKTLLAFMLYVSYFYR